MRPLILTLVALWWCAWTPASGAEIHVGEVRLALDETGRLVGLGSDGATRWTVPRDTASYPASGPVMRPDGFSVWYGWGSYLLAVDAGTGTVLERIPLPEVIRAITAADPDGVRVECGGPNASDRYASVYRGGAFDPPLVGHSASVQMVREAIVFAPDAFQVNDWTVEVVPSHVSEELVERYEQARRDDPTNPWLLVLEGLALNALGRRLDAEPLWERALAHPLADSAQRLLMGFAFEQAPLPAWADRAYDASYAAFLQEGHEPELATAVSPALLISKVASRLARERQIDRARTVLGWSRRFSPFCEGRYASNLYEAWWFTRQGLDEEAHALRAINRRPEMRAAGPFGLPPSLPPWLDLILAGIVAVGLTLSGSVLCWVVRYRTYFRALRARRAEIKRLPHRERWRLGLGLALWRRQTLTWLLQAGIGLILAAFGGAALEAMGRAGEAPPVWNGFLGHPRMLRYLEGQQHAHPSPASTFVYAYSCQLGGRREAAQQGYESLRSDRRYGPRALNNLGVIAWERGERKTVHAYVRQAADRAPTLAAASYNLWLMTREPQRLEATLAHDTDRIRRQQRYRPEQPLLAPPDAEDRLEAMIGVRRWYTLMPGVLTLLLSGKSVQGMSVFRAPPPAKAPATRSGSHPFFLVAVGLLLLLGLSWVLFSQGPSVGATSSPVVWPTPTPDEPVPSLWYALCPGTYQLVDGHHLVGGALVFLTSVSAMEQWFLQRFDAPGVLSGLMGMKNLLVDFGEPLSVVLRVHDPVWRAMDVGSITVLVGCVVCNLVWIGAAVRRRRQPARSR